MKVAIVHDDLVQFGGAERVLAGICEIFPEAPIYTSVYDRDNQSLQRLFGSKKIHTSFLQKIPGVISLYKALLPLYGIAFEQFDFSDYDLVISHTSRFAKAVITKPETLHICYCLTPPRFLWHFSGEGSYGLLESILSPLRIFDRVFASRVDFFLANSKNTDKRIKKIYGRDSKVVYPFIDLERFAGVEPFDGEYFVVIARLNKYKRVDLTIDACRELNLPLKIIGSGPELDNLRIQSAKFKVQSRGNIEFLEHLDDNDVIQVLAGCKALIIPGIEDFGITSLEAQALGKPVVAFKEGGVLETVIDGETGIFFEEQSVGILKKALCSNVLNHWNKQEKCKENARSFSKENFKKEFRKAINSFNSS